MIAASNLEQFTQNTPPSESAFRAELEQTLGQGFARGNQSYEADVIGTAVAFFGANGRPAGAIAVAAVASRFDGVLARKIETALMTAGQKLTRELGGVQPAANHQSPLQEHLT